MNDRNVILTGLPRSGTTLTCHLLNKVTNTVALHEPMDVARFGQLESHDAICDEIDGFFDASRRSILTRHTAVSKQVDGSVPDNPFGDERSSGGLRKSLHTRGEIAVTQELTPGFTLAIKHNNAFTAILGSLIKRFSCYAMIRNPLSVLASWNSAAIPKQQGRAYAAERLDAELAQTLVRIPDVIMRQLHLLSWFFEIYNRVLPAEAIIRYEDMVSSGGTALSVIAPEAGNLTERLENKNNNSLYDQDLMRVLGKKLLNTDGAYWAFYSRENVESVLEE